MLLSRKHRCNVEVQVVMGQSTQHVGASSVVALAMKAGDVLFDLTASLQLTVSGSDNDGTYSPGQAGTDGISFSGLAAKMLTSTAKGKSVTGWEVGYRVVLPRPMRTSAKVCTPASTQVFTPANVDCY